MHHFLRISNSFRYIYSIPYTSKHTRSPLGYGTLVLFICRMRCSYLSRVLTQVRRMWRSLFPFFPSHALLIRLLLQPFYVLYMTHCTWLEIRRWVLRNIARVSPSLHSYHYALLLRLRLVVDTIHSVPLATFEHCPSWLGQSFGSFLAIHTISFSLISLQRMWCFITFQFHLPYVPWYSCNDTLTS